MTHSLRRGWRTTQRMAYQTKVLNLHSRNAINTVRMSDDGRWGFYDSGFRELRQELSTDKILPFDSARYGERNSSEVDREASSGA